MGLFSGRSRRILTSAPDAPAEVPPEVPEPTRPAVTDAEPDSAPSLRERPPLGTKAGGNALRESLQQLLTRRPARDHYAAEAIALIATAANIKTAALLVYDPPRGSLRLLAQVGLEADAVAALNGETPGAGWDIPLRGVRNRRINVIESAHENPFVPRAFAAISPRRLTIAALPFFHANAPVGAVVLFSPAARAFTDSALQALSQALRVCALALSELRPAEAHPSPREDPPAAEEQPPTLLRGLASLKAELARLTEALDTAERERANEAAERVTAQSFLASAEERAVKLEQEVAALRVVHLRVPGLEEEIQALSRRLAEATDHGAASGQEIQQLRQRLAAQEEHTARQAAALQESAAQCQALEQQLAAAQSTARAYGDETQTLQARLAELDAQASELRALREAVCAAEQATAASRARVDALQEELRDAQAKQRDVEVAAAHLRDELAASGETQQRLVRELAEKELLLQSAEEDLGDLDLGLEDADTVLAIQRDGTALDATVIDAGHAAPASEPAQGDLIVFDDTRTAAQTVARLVGLGHRASALPANAAGVEQLRGRHVAAAAVNVAGAAAWELLHHLRNGSAMARMPLLAYALADDAPNAFWLGPIDVAILPAGQLDLANALAELAPKVKRVIAMGSDIDVMSQVRTQLVGAGISTAVVLDGRQALDLLAVIRPEAAVLHVSPNTADLFRVIAGVRSADVTRGIPILFLLDAQAPAQTEVSLSAGLRALTSRADLSADRLAETLAAAFDRLQA